MYCITISSINDYAVSGHVLPRQTHGHVLLRRDGASLFNFGYVYFIYTFFLSRSQAGRKGKHQCGSYDETFHSFLQIGLLPDRRQQKRDAAEPTQCSPGIFSRRVPHWNLPTWRRLSDQLCVSHRRNPRHPARSRYRPEQRAIPHFLQIFAFIRGNCAIFWQCAPGLA